MRTARLLLAVFCTILCNLISGATPVSGDSIKISLITCYPGPEIFELCGHEALRVRKNGTDSVWNYGTFDFDEPNFVYRFVKGETDYMLSGYPFEYFLPSYQAQGRKIVEQELNLSQAEAKRLLTRLQNEGLPENRRYRYNYVKDNCATRIVDRIEEISDRKPIFPDTISYGTFRNTMRAYHKKYPWYQFGIDVALGSGIDKPISGREEMFVPVEMMRRMEAAHFDDGRPLVKETRILFEGEEDATLAATPFYLTPLFISCLLFIICLITSIYDYRKKVTSRWLYSLYFGMAGTAGLIVTFLVFVSEHEATSPNILILWLNPLQLVFAAGIWSRKMRFVNITLAFYNICVVGLMLLVWFFQSQSANPAFFPLIASGIMLSTVYASLQSMTKTGPTRRKRGTSVKRKKSK